ncbi:MAG: response regulator [Lachnospiraceae bacterium]|nr:response regulator [Lachnospiraceae bacterium]
MKESSKNVLLIGELSREFDSFHESLKSYYPTVKVELGTSDIETAITDGSFGLIIIFIEGFIKWKHFPIKKCAKDIIKNNIPVALIADSEDVAAVKSYLSEIHIEAFERPIQINELVASFKKLMSESKGDWSSVVHKRKIIVVENDKDTINVIAKSLGMIYDVYFVPSVGDAFVSYGRNGADMIMMNYSMPDCDGASSLKMFQKANATRDIPIVCIENEDSKYKIQECMELNPAACLIRPVTKDLLLEITSKHII